MSTGPKRTRTEATADAISFRGLFVPECYCRWEFVGSLRRGCSLVSDIDHLIVPSFGEVPGSGLFAERTSLLWHHLDALLASGIVGKHWNGTSFKWGQISRAVDFGGVCHEIHTCDPEAWGANLAIRTGGEEMSRRLVTALGNGGMYRHVGGFKIETLSGEPVPTPDEEVYFKLCGVPFVPPSKRD